MLRMTALFKKFALAALIMAIALALFPFSSASAAGLYSQTIAQPDYSRLENLSGTPAGNLPTPKRPSFKRQRIYFQGASPHR